MVYGMWGFFELLVRSAVDILLWEVVGGSCQSQQRQRVHAGHGS